MAQNSILLEKSLNFAERIVKLQKYLVKEKHEGIISKQIIRSATSIGANANEAIYGISKADFVAKLFLHFFKNFGEEGSYLGSIVLCSGITQCLLNV